MNFVGEIWSNIANLFCPIFFFNVPNDKGKATQLKGK